MIKTDGKKQMMQMNCKLKKNSNFNYGFIYFRSLQLSVINLMCKFGNQDCKDKASEYYENWKNNGKQ